MLYSFERRLVNWLVKFNHILHAALALALVVASLMVMWQFVTAVYQSLLNHNITEGFLQALGTLFIVWTLSSLISAEIDYVKTGIFQVTVFIEVAIITLLRQLIVEPFKITQTDELSAMEHFIAQNAVVLSGLLIVGILHRLVSSAGRQPGRESEESDGKIISYQQTGKS